LLEPNIDADATLERWKKCRDTINSNHKLYLYWKEVCDVFERQAHYIEKKSQLISLLNAAPKEVCDAISQVIILEVQVKFINS
jgi:hypothetical protein